MEFEGSKTQANLMKALAGESVANTKYQFYADMAKKEGYQQIGNIFLETAGNEKEHAEMWFKALHDGKIPTTEKNLNDAISGEGFENLMMYPEFAQIAREEGFDNIARMFDGVGKIENSHGERFKALLNNLKTGMVFEKTQEVVWVCLNCGHLHYAKSAPKKCPVCGYPQAYFEVQCKNY